MGQKTHPTGNRLGINKTWDSRWYSKANYAKQLHEDLFLKKHIKDKLYHSGIGKVDIERAGQKIKIIIHTARPGIIIGKKGAEVENLKRSIESAIKTPVSIDIKEIRKPELDAQLVAENIAMQIEKRVAYRRAMKKSVLSSMRFGALGVKVACSGRLSGAEIARAEWYKEGRIPLHTFRADIDYGFAESKTTYGIIGVKAWIYKGDVLPESKGSA
ncbi:MAG: 30S ribosomal protein S3 [Nitrospirae bacterium]|nr:30S ribosomal protein S3 [Nitrospirota bacterium]